MTNLANRLKNARISKGLTILEVSNKTGISTGNLSELENGKHDPSAKALVLLSELYEVSVDWILKGEHVRLENTSCDQKSNIICPPEELMLFLGLITEAWFNGDHKTHGWIIVQLRRSFPEIAELVKKKAALKSTAQNYINAIL